MWPSRSIAAVNIVIAEEANRALTAFAVADDLGGASIVENNHVAGLELAARPNQRAPLPRCRIRRLEQHDLQAFCVPGAVSEQARRQHARIVQDQRIAGAKVIRKIPELAVFKSIFRAMYNQHARAIPLRRRLLGDQFFG